MKINGAIGLENYFSIDDICELENNQNLGFTYIKVDNYIKSSYFQAMIDEIHSTIKLENYDYSRNNYNLEKKYYNDSIIIIASGNSRDTAFTIYSKNEFLLNTVFTIYLKHIGDESESEVRAFFNTFYIKQNGLDKTTNILTLKDVCDVSELYYPFLDTKLMFEQYCTGAENILILSGEAGLGKCLHRDEEIDIYVDDDMKKITIKIGDLFEKLNLNKVVLEETGYKNTENIFVKTPSGELTKINYFVKKPKQEIISVKLENDIVIKCSPNHIFIDKNKNNVLAKNAIEIQTMDGVKKIIKKEKIEDDELYDISIDSPHLYVSTNGVIHHNTKFSNLLFKHLFNEPENIPYDKLESIPELSEQFFNVAYVKSTDILAMDEFWRTIQKDLPDFVILDDLDYMLTNRAAEVTSNDDVKKNAFLNQLLSFTDGVHKNKTKFIITTNQHFDDVDSALLRKGRLFDILEFRKLTYNEALKIWLNASLDKDEFDTLFTDEILQSDLGSEIAKRKNKRIQNSISSYLKEPTISKIKRKTKRMSL